MEKFKTFWTDLFTAMNTEDSIAVLVFLGVSFLLGLLFGAWSRAGKIRRLKCKTDEWNAHPTTNIIHPDTKKEGKQQ